MQIVRTVIWVLLLVALVLFSVNNWADIVTVRIWDNIVVDTKIPAIVVVSFLIGFVPMWLYYRGSKWNLNRKIASLESAARTAAATPVAAEPTDEPEEAAPAPSPAPAPMPSPAPNPAPTASTVPNEPVSDLTPTQDRSDISKL
ncbi:LapA family protein [Aurantiacibacter sediminis]|uniref:LapA family protein n=1 Tax=Aurantiacibacter sediminis TaxID=2793064 RepID=A0ABS0N2Y2_9SPHN|nr:LapA family protein [Aurantiacibacter sediminis]MBH5322324.1 LapA family protein [Aurantiacibacter sediminis]